MSQDSRLQPYQKHCRPNAMEGRLSSQERTLAVLLEQAFRIKEEVAAGLQSTHASVQVEALSRRLLENHIITVTRIVKQLSVDIQALESQIAQRDSVTSGTSFAVQSLDQKNVAVIGDLRGRVTRCDASIAKLSASVSSGERQVIKLQQEVTQLRSALDLQLKELELKIYHDIGRVEASLSEHSRGQKNAMCDLQSQTELLEAKMSAGLKAAKEQADALRRWTEQQHHSSAQIHAQDGEQLRSSLQDTMFETESRLSERLRALEGLMERFEAQRGKADHSQAEQLKGSETKLSKRMTSLESNLHQELQLLKQEYHKGFKGVHDAIESLKQIADIKSRLDKQKFQRDV
ncbi:protein FAM81B [Genypterus blacodes]|uniref:protein FAM81B n=1 Tax=Genypterus blacodes TaxID=154954 RepID=UPI003F7781F2